MNDLKGENRLIQGDKSNKKLFWLVETSVFTLQNHFLWKYLFYQVYYNKKMNSSLLSAIFFNFLWNIVVSIKD